MSRIIRNALIAFGVIAALLVIVGLIIALREPKYTAVPMPNPNGYDDLVKAAAMTVLYPIRGTNEYAQDTLVKIVATNAAALKLARAGLSRECCVPIGGSFTNAALHLSTVNGFYDIAGAFRREGRLAELEHRPADAARSYLDITQLGQEIMRGGVLLDGMTGSAVEGMGLISLEKLSPPLTVEQCKQVAVALAAADAKRETAANIVQRTKLDGRRAWGLKYYLHLVVTSASLQKGTGIAVQSQRTRKLIITLAARAFELEHKAKPKAIADLVPAYLKTIPKDPVTGKDMTYPP